MFGASEEMHVEHLQDNAINIVETICSVICQPVEIILRPQYGTRYFPVPVTFFSSAMMLLLPGFMLLFSNFMNMIPLLHAQQPVGMFGLGDYAKLYFLLSAFHGVRLWRRMIYMEREQHSEYEGPALPFFQIVKSFWIVRIVVEPASVLIVSIVLQDLFIAQPSLALYLKLAALALLMKNFIAWFRAWEYMRKILDMRIAGPLISKLIDGTATAAEIQPLHIVSIPKNIDPEVRRATLAHYARSYTQE